MKKESGFLQAGDGASLAWYLFECEGTPRGIIQICHGMAEYAMRYERFAEAACARGFTVWAHDHRGHGQTAGSLDRAGYLADGDGFSRVVEDLRLMNTSVSQRFPSVPLYLLAHSFGSFVGQEYIQLYGAELAGCIISGSSGPKPVAVALGRLAADLRSFFRGRYKKDYLLDRLMFGTYNKGISEPQSPNAWLSRDPAEVEKYDASPWTGFVCTTGFFQDFIRGLSRIQSRRAVARVPSSLPIFIVAGERDPVGNHGKTLPSLEGLFTRAGLRDVQLKLYPGARHEILNETNRDEVTADILDWIESRIGAGGSRES